MTFLSADFRFTPSKSAIVGRSHAAEAPSLRRALAAIDLFNFHDLQRMRRRVDGVRICHTFASLFFLRVH